MALVGLGVGRCTSISLVSFACVCGTAPSAAWLPLCAMPGCKRITTDGRRRVTRTNVSSVPLVLRSSIFCPGATPPAPSVGRSPRPLAARHAACAAALAHRAEPAPPQLAARHAAHVSRPYRTAPMPAPPQQARTNVDVLDARPHHECGPRRSAVSPSRRPLPAVVHPVLRPPHRLARGPLGCPHAVLTGAMGHLPLE